jgi:hypothetical protein
MHHHDVMPEQTGSMAEKPSTTTNLGVSEAERSLLQDQICYLTTENACLESR